MAVAFYRNTCAIFNIFAAYSRAYTSLIADADVVDSTHMPQTWTRGGKKGREGDGTETEWHVVVGSSLLHISQTSRKLFAPKSGRTKPNKRWPGPETVDTESASGDPGYGTRDRSSVTYGTLPLQPAHPSTITDEFICVKATRA